MILLDEEEVAHIRIIHRCCMFMSVLVEVVEQGEELYLNCGRILLYHLQS
jgi:hypothetical protein